MKIENHGEVNDSKTAEENMIKLKYQFLPKIVEVSKKQWETMHF